MESILSINENTWTAVNVPTAENPLQVRSFSLARPQRVFFFAQLALFSASVISAMWRNEAFGATAVIGCCAIAFCLKALDRSILRSSAARFRGDFATAVGWGMAASVTVLFAFPVLGSWMSAALAGLVPAILLPMVLRPTLVRLALHNKFVERILIVGNGTLAEKLYDAVSTGKSTFGQARLLRFPGDLGEASDMTDFSHLPDLLIRQRISRVLVAEQNVETRGKLAAALVTPRLNGLLVVDAGDFYEQHFGKVWIDALNSEWFVYTTGFKQSKAKTVLKRCFDVVFAALLLILAAPVMLILAIAIKLESAGPVFFRQVRVGQNGKTFVIYKFRSMREDAEVDGGPVWATEFDDRVTRFGRFLRKCHVDEIPQAFNVLRGEMSLVGPRPERPVFVDRLEEQIPFYTLRHCVKPGITGLAQVSYRYGSSVRDSGEKLQYDLYYAKHVSHAFDTGILLKTVEMVLFGKGR